MITRTILFFIIIATGLFCFQSLAQDGEVFCENSEDIQYIQGKKYCTNWSESEAPINNRCEEVYVPPHTLEELIAVRDWAVGRAFLVFSQKAGFEFDGEQYGKDAPYLGLFNFGFATAKTCLSEDVVGKYAQVLQQLRVFYYQSQNSSEHEAQVFSSKYFELAQEYGMDIYLSLRG